MSLFEEGAVYNYNYLWARESRQGEETGRKARPACLLIKFGSNPERLYLFALSTREPRPQSLAIEIPASERRRGGLSQPCWLVLDEYNVASATQPHDFEALHPLGSFSRTFLRQIAAALKEAGRKRRLVAVIRT